MTKLSATVKGRTREIEGMCIERTLAIRDWTQIEQFSLETRLISGDESSMTNISSKRSIYTTFAD